MSVGVCMWVRVCVSRIENRSYTTRHIFTQFGLSSGSRLDYFIVGVTNVPPNITTPVRGSYPVCGQYPYPASDRARMVQCCGANTPPGRYVIIQQPVNGSDFLTICELEVYCYPWIITMDRAALHSTLESWCHEASVEQLSVRNLKSTFSIFQKIM